MSAQADPDAEAAKRNDEWAKKNLDHAITFAVEALKAAMLLNGGAAVALLTLVGALAVKDNTKVQFTVGAIKSALFCYGFGVLAIIATFSLAYLSQLNFMSHVNTRDKSHEKWAVGLRFVAVACILVSGVLFIFGTQSALDGIKQSLRPSENLDMICRAWPGLPYMSCVGS